MSGRLPNSDWFEWFDGKCINFLRFINSTVTKYADVLGMSDTEFVDHVIKKCDELETTGPARMMVFSKMARQQMSTSVPSLIGWTRTAKRIYLAPQEQKSKEYQDFVAELEHKRTKFDEIIEYLKYHEHEVLPDLNKLAGYLALFYGDFITEEEETENKNKIQDQ